MKDILFSNFNHRKCDVRTLLCLQEEKEATNYENEHLENNFV